MPFLAYGERCEKRATRPAGWQSITLRRVYAPLGHWDTSTAFNARAFRRSPVGRDRRRARAWAARERATRRLDRRPAPRPSRDRVGLRARPLHARGRRHPTRAEP